MNTNNNINNKKKFNNKTNYTFKQIKELMINNF